MAHGHILASNNRLFSGVRELIGTYVPPQPVP